MHTRSLIACSLIPLAFALQTQPAYAEPSAEQLIQQLQSSGESGRVEARQLLVREGVEVVPQLIPLLGHQDQRVWRTACNVLGDIANEACAAGYPKNRVRMTAQLMRVLAETQFVEVKQRVLRILPTVIPAGYDVTPMALLLDDPQLREQARTALQVTGTPEACAALTGYLKVADPHFTCALLDSLARLQNTESTGSIKPLTAHEDPRVRAAAARSLAWTGDVSLIERFHNVCAKADDATRFEATDALLQLADAIGGKKEHPEEALKIYRSVLDTSDHIVLRSAAIVGLGKYGDDSAVAEILKAVQGEDGTELEPAALSAFAAMTGNKAYREMLQTYPTLSRDMRLSLLDVFGRKRDTIFYDTLTDALRSNDDAFRRAAIAAMAHAELPESTALLAEFARRGTEEKDAAVEAIQRVAEALQARGDHARAGIAFLDLYAATDDVAVRRIALERIGRNPIPEATETILAAMENPELEEAATHAMIASVGLQIRRGQTEEAQKLLSYLVPRARTTRAIGQLIGLTRRAGVGAELAPHLGFITNWLVVGPFSWSAEEGFAKKNVNEPDVDLSARYSVEDKKLSWQPHTTSDAGGFVDLLGILGQHDNVAAYAYSEIDVEKDTDAIFLAGSDDGIKIWVNGKAIHENNTGRAAGLDQDRAETRLKAGTNPILVEITQSISGWAFCLRVANPDGSPVKVVCTVPAATRPR